MWAIRGEREIYSKVGEGYHKPIDPAGSGVILRGRTWREFLATVSSMSHTLRGCIVAAMIAQAALLFSSSQLEAATVMSLDLGADIDPDVQSNVQFFSTLPDGDWVPPTGEQSSRIEFLNFLDDIPDISTPFASANLILLPAGPFDFSNFPNVVQEFGSGVLSVYDASHTLLLEAQLPTTTLSGSISNPHAVLSTNSFATITAGTLASRIKPNSLNVSMDLTIYGDGVAPYFLADATLDISAEPAVQPVQPIQYVHLAWDENAPTAIDRQVVAGKEIFIPVSGTVQVAPPALPGDYNGDGSVDAADYVVWPKTGVNGQAGYNTWRANFGNVLPPGAGSGAVAEQGAGSGGTNTALAEPVAPAAGSGARVVSAHQHHRC